LSADVFQISQQRQARAVSGNSMTPPKLILPIIMFVQTIYCWWCFFYARGLPYDDNYGILIQAILLSMTMWVSLRMIRAWKKAWYQIPRFIFWTWIIVGSPLSYVIGLIFYRELFGHLAL